MTPYPLQLQTFAARLPAPLYAVGGCVRDTLLQKLSHDIDLCSANRPETIRQAAEREGIACRLVNERLGTVQLVLGERTLEHTTFRTESYPPGGAHRPAEIAFTDDLKQDAFRRDFSINAIYQDVRTGELIDPTGGLDDLNKRLLRTTTADPCRILCDDGLRILRLVRFAISTGFSIEEQTWQCAQKSVRLLDDVAWERKRQELDRLLVFDDVFRALSLLRELGALFRLIPELSEADGMAQRSDYHRYDVLTHLFRTCEAMPPEVPLRLMGLLHDVGKPACKRETGNFHRHAVYGERMTETILKRLTYPNAMIVRVKTAVRHHMFDLDGRAKESTLKKQFVLWGKAGVLDWIRLREADFRGSGYRTDYVADRWRSVYEEMLLNGCPWSESELAVTGSDIMDALHLPPSPAVSALKTKLLLHCACHPKDNERERLLRLLTDFRNKSA